MVYGIEVGELTLVKYLHRSALLLVVSAFEDKVSTIFSSPESSVVDGLYRPEQMEGNTRDACAAAGNQDKAAVPWKKQQSNAVMPSIKGNARSFSYVSPHSRCVCEEGATASLQPLTSGVLPDPTFCDPDRNRATTIQHRPESTVILTCCERHGQVQHPTFSGAERNRSVSCPVLRGPMRTHPVASRTPRTVVCTMSSAGWPLSRRENDVHRPYPPRRQSIYEQALGVSSGKLPELNIPTTGSNTTIPPCKPKLLFPRERE